MGSKSLLTIGRVTGIHGLKGYLKVQSFAESIAVFKKGIQLNARHPGEEKGSWYEILNASPYKKGVRLLLKNVDINNAEALIGKDLLTARENCYNYNFDSDFDLESDSAPDLNHGAECDPKVGSAYHCSIDSQSGLEEDTYFWEDLTGMSVIDLKDGYLGKIAYIMATGSNDVFVVQGGKREVLVPGLKSVVLSVDIHKNEMKIDLPEGL